MEQLTRTYWQKDGAKSAKPQQRQEPVQSQEGSILLTAIDRTIIEQSMAY